MCSDHETLLSDFICECKVTYNGNERYLYRKCELADFASDWGNVDWIEKGNTEEMWTLYAQKYDECVKKYVPKSKPRKGCRPKPLWITSETV